MRAGLVQSGHYLYHRIKMRARVAQ